jgi:predicted transposase YbfD/YdcC
MQIARQTFTELFEHLDPRDFNARHDFCEIIFIAVAASLCGAKNCSDMARFGQEKEAMLREVLVLEHGIPSHDVFSGVLRHVAPAAFAEALQQLFQRMAAAVGRNRQIAIDGKAMRGAFETGRRHAPRMMVTAWGKEVRMTLAAQPVERGNEARAALELLALLDLEGAIVTADALHCSKAVAAAVVEGGGDYALALKGNQGPLHAAATALVDKKAPMKPDALEEEEAHGREETRAARVIPVPRAWAKRYGFPRLAAIGVIWRTRRVKGQRRSKDRCLYALSRVMTAAELADVARGHWDIENGLHWGLDVVFREDECRTRKDHGPENLALIRRICVNALRADAKNDTMRGKSMRAGWNDSYLLQLMTHLR